MGRNSNLGKARAASSGPRPYNPDAIPDGYDPRAWRLSKYFKDFGESRGHFIKQSVLVIYSLMAYWIDSSEKETEEILQELIEYYWLENFLLKSNPDYAMDQFFSTKIWKLGLETIKDRRYSKKLRAEHEQRVAEQGPAEPDFPVGPRKAKPPWGNKKPFVPSREQITEDDFPRLQKKLNDWVERNKNPEETE